MCLSRTPASASALGSTAGTLFCSTRKIWFAELTNSLIENYPDYEKTLRESLRTLVGEDVEKRVDIGMAKDGSGVGGMSSSILSPLLQLTNFPQPHCAPYKLSNNSVYLQSRCNNAGPSNHWFCHPHRQGTQLTMSTIGERAS